MVSSITANGEADSMNGPILELEDEGHSGIILAALNKMRKNKYFCDVILHVDNLEIHGHRAVLASASPYFFELFSSDDQNKEQKKRTYKLNSDMDKYAVQKLVNYAYTSKLQILPHDVKSVYMVACRLKMDRVITQCASYLLDSLTNDNCLDIRALPGIAQNESFIKQVEAYIRQNFSAVCRSPALRSLPLLKIEVLYQTMQEMSLVTGTTLSCLVLDWIKRFLTDSNKSRIEQLTEKTYLLYLALDNSLQDCADLPSGDVSDTDLVQDYKKMSLKSHAQNKSRRKGNLQPAKPRVLIYSKEVEDRLEEQLEPDWNVVGVEKVGEHTFLAIVTLNGRLATLSILLRLNIPASPQCQETERNCSSKEGSVGEPELYCALPTMKSGRCAVGCADLNGKLLVCGGYDRVECLKSVDHYIPETNTWEILSPMKEARGRFGIAVVKGKVYAIGGSNGTTELATVEVLDPKNGWKWSRVASLPSAKSHSGICALNDIIYCVGGWNGQAGIRQCDIFDPDTGVWLSIAPLNTGRYQAGVCAYKDKVYAVGGCDSWNCLNSVEIYDPETNTWVNGPPLITPRRGCGLAVFQGRLYAVGGSSGTHSLTTTEVYDPIEQVWVPGPSLSTPRANVAVAVVEDRLYAVGGFSGKNFLNSIEYLDYHCNEWTTFVPKTDGIKTPPLLENSNGSESETNSNGKESPKLESAYQ